MMEGRKEDGTFAEGHKLATGRPKSVFQDFSPRAGHFLQTLTRSQILTIAASDTEMDKYSAFDTSVILHLANMLKGKDDQFAATERERLMDRTTGKPKQALTGGDEHDMPIRIVTTADADIIARYQQQKIPEKS